MHVKVLMHWYKQFESNTRSESYNCEHLTKKLITLILITWKFVKLLASEMVCGIPLLNVDQKTTIPVFTMFNTTIAFVT